MTTVDTLSLLRQSEPIVIVELVLQNRCIRLGSIVIPRASLMNPLAQCSSVRLTVDDQEWNAESAREPHETLTLLPLQECGIDDDRETRSQNRFSQLFEILVHRMVRFGRVHL